MNNTIIIIINFSVAFWTIIQVQQFILFKKIKILTNNLEESDKNILTSDIKRKTIKENDNNISTKLIIKLKLRKLKYNNIIFMILSITSAFIILIAYLIGMILLENNLFNENIYYQIYIIGLFFIIYIAYLIKKIYINTINLKQFNNNFFKDFIDIKNEINDIDEFLANEEDKCNKN